MIQTLEDDLHNKTVENNAYKFMQEGMNGQKEWGKRKQHQ